MMSPDGAFIRGVHYRLEKNSDQGHYSKGVHAHHLKEDVNKGNTEFTSFLFKDNQTMW